MSIQPRLILITGKARHGKDTIADYCVKQYGFQKYMVAQPLKDICRIMFNFTESQVNGQDKDTIDERWGIAPRLCLQFVGTELMREQIGTILPDVGQNIWIKCLADKLQRILATQPDAKFVISDVRYENELSFLAVELSLPTISLRVVNPRVTSTGVTAHCSEEQLFATNHIIENDSTFEHLYQQIDELFKLD